MIRRERVEEDDQKEDIDENSFSFDLSSDEVGL